MKTKIILSAISLTIVLTLGLHLYVVYAIFNPKTDEAYTNYYINRSTSIPPAGLKNLHKLPPITFGMRYTHFDDNILGFDGWSSAEATHRWTNQKIAHIRFKIENIELLPKELHIVMDLNPFKTQRVDLLINDKHLLSEKMDHPTLLALKISKFDLHNGMNVLTFLLPDAKRPGMADTRLLAVSLKSFSLQE